MTQGHIAMLLQAGFLLVGMQVFTEAIGSENPRKRMVCSWIAALHVVAFVTVRLV